MKYTSKDKKELWNKIIQEGDSKVFYHHGLKCQILRHPSMGHLCGYVFNKEGVKHWRYEDDCESNYPCDTSYDVHGGITYDNDVKLGFDLAHLGDLTPYSILNPISIHPCFMYEDDDEEYRDMAYAKMEVKRLADQIYQYNLQLKRDKKNGRKNK